MKTAWWRSLLALVCGWLGASILYLAYILPTTMAFMLVQGAAAMNGFGSIVAVILIVGGFALAGWILTILPLTSHPRTREWMIHPKFTEVVWSLAAVISYILLVTSWAGPASLLMIWIPAAIGAFSGLSYRWLMRRPSIR